jgi:Zn-dependent protease with chaperone function
MNIDPKAYVAPGTGLHTFIGWLVLLVFAPLLLVVTIVATYGVALVIWIVLGIFYFARVRQAQARLKGSAVQVSESQFPVIHARVQEYATRLGLKEVPRVFVIEDNHQNAAALKHGSKRYVLLIDDIVYGAEVTGNKKTLDFIIAHELAHHALGHTNVWRHLIALRYPTLSRLDEFSCDAVAHALVGDADAAHDALALLLIGPYLYQRVNRAALTAQSEEVSRDKDSKRSERRLSHPLLLRRYHAITNPTAV